LRDEDQTGFFISRHCPRLPDIDRDFSGSQAKCLDTWQSGNARIALVFIASHMSTQEAYTNWSTTYDLDRNLTRDLDQRVTKATLGDLRYRSVLEIGCGTGKNTALLGEIAGQVLALDFSTGMLARAKERLRSDNVSFIVADVTSRWPCMDQFADLIVCNLVLEHVEDLSFVFSEAARTLAAGGRFFICELHPYRQYQGTQAHFRREQETIDIPAFIHHVSEFISKAQNCGLSLQNFGEWWHEADRDKPPRLISLIFEK